MSDERKPTRDLEGHTTIPPELRSFGGKGGAEGARVRGKSAGAQAMFAQISEELGEEGQDVQEIDAGRGVGNARAYVGPVTVPAGAVGKGVTAKVKIDAGKAKSDPPPGLAAEESPWAKEGPAVIAAGELPSALLPKTAEGGVVESARPEGKDRRRGVVALVVGGVVALGLAAVTVSQIGGPKKAPQGAPLVGPSSDPVGVASSSGVPSAPSSASTGTGVPTVETVVPVPSAAPAVGSAAPAVSAPVRKPKEDGVVEDPYDAAPPPSLPKTGAPVVPPAPTGVPSAVPVAPPAVTVAPKATSNPFDKPNYD